MDKANIPGGAFLVARQIIESEIMDKPPLYIKVWIYLLARAQHSDYKGLKRGQLITSIPEIQEACSWRVGARKEVPTKRQIQVILDWMRSVSMPVSRNPDEQSSNVTTSGAMIVTSKVTHGMLVTISNYAVYQDLKNYERYTERYDEGYDEQSPNVTGTLQYKQECNKNETRMIEQPRNPDPDDSKPKPERLVSSQDVESFVESQMASNPLDLNKKLLIKYIDCLRLTRKTGKLSANIIKTEWEKWKQYHPDIVSFAMLIHITKHKDKREEYTRGIMRRTELPEARRGLMKLKNKSDWGGIVDDNQYARGNPEDAEDPALIFDSYYNQFDIFGD